MDPVSSGASVLAFVGLVLQCTKSLYKAISGFKNAPKETAALISATGNLQIILTQLRDCRALAEPSVDLQNIWSLLEACNKDIASFEKDLGKILCSPTTPKLQQAWKKVKATFVEKSLTGIWNKLNHHCTVLQFQLNLLQSNATLDCKDQIHELQATVSAGNLHVSSLNDNMQNVMISVEEIIRSTAASVTHTVGQASGATATQLENIATLLGALQGQISGNLHQFNVSQQHPALSQESSSWPPNTDESSQPAPQLTRSLERLSALRSREQDTIHDEEAETIIEDLECLLNALSESQEDNEPTSSGKRKADDEQDATVTRRDMKRLRGLVSAATAIDVNHAPKRLSPKRYGKLIQTRKSMGVVFPGCKTIISINRRMFQQYRKSAKPELLATQPYAEEVFASIKAFVDDPESPSVIVAYIRQIQFQNGFSSLHPVISIGKTLPDDSLIFQIVMNGDVDELQRLLGRGEGTLRDRDSYGTPLLHVSEQ